MIDFQKENRELVMTNHTTGKKVSVGWIRYGKYFTDRQQNHFMYKFQGFGISQKILDYIKIGVEYVEITYHKENGSKSKFECKLSQFLESNLIHDDKGDLQRFIPVSEMSKIE